MRFIKPKSGSNPTNNTAVYHKVIQCSDEISIKEDKPEFIKLRVVALQILVIISEYQN